MVYALRMQHERMDGSFVPSLREYAAQYQIDGRRLATNQLVMHPGPVNRGVELSAEVIDSPQALISHQVEAGVVVRMAVLYELLAGGPPADLIQRPRLRGRRDLGAPTRMSRLDHLLDRQPAPGADILITGAHLLDPRAGTGRPRAT